MEYRACHNHHGLILSHNIHFAGRGRSVFLLATRDAAWNIYISLKILYLNGDDIYIVLYHFIIFNKNIYFKMLYMNILYYIYI